MKITKTITTVSGEEKQVLDLPKVAYYFAKNIPPAKHGNMVTIEYVSFFLDGVIRVRVELANGYNSVFHLHSHSTPQMVKETLADVKNILNGKIVD